MCVCVRERERERGGRVILCECLTKGIITFAFAFLSVGINRILHTHEQVDLKLGLSWHLLTGHETNGRLALFAASVEKETRRDSTRGHLEMIGCTRR